MNRYEKQSFFKIFLGYFISVTIFVLILGYLYFHQQRIFILQKTAMNMHQYLLKLKQSHFDDEQDGYSYDIVEHKKVIFQLPIKDDDVYFKVFTPKLIIFVDAIIVDKEINDLKTFTIILQISLILFFAFISYILAKRSLRPMIEALAHLDNFTKDLIHDLNTPITSILLNTRLLKKTADEKSIIKVNRIENSAKNISSLYENLEILLKGNELKKDTVDLKIIINDLICTYSQIYPNIKFGFESKELIVNTNNIAIKRVLDNIISNACKYSKNENGNINIKYENNILTIQDNGKGIKYPNKIFQRNYKEYDSGFGIGMHIVYRILSSLDHNINIESTENIGTKVNISF